MKILMVVVSLALSLAGAAFAQPLRIVSEGPAVQLGATQFVVHSEKVGRDFLVKVQAPMAPVPPGARLPVIYALDGGYEIAGPITWVLGGSGAMEPAFVVSVGYQPSEYHWRDSDLSHHEHTDERGRLIAAGGAAYEAFLMEELRPLIESRYPVEPARAVLFGHSLGGVFTAHVLAERPAAFLGYVIASPAIWSDPDILPRLRRSVGTAGERPVFLAVGGSETQQMLKAEADMLGALTRPDSHLRVKSQVFEGATHIAYYPALITVAFPWLLPPKS